MIPQLLYESNIYFDFVFEMSCKRACFAFVKLLYGDFIHFFGCPRFVSGISAYKSQLFMTSNMK